MIELKSGGWRVLKSGATQYSRKNPAGAQN
jgi:hypothetical protein